MPVGLSTDLRNDRLDLIATAIHRRSRRVQRPLIRVNCAALPASALPCCCRI